MGLRVVHREGLSTSLSVGVVVGQIVILSAGLSFRMSGGLDVFLNVGTGVGFSIIRSLEWEMVGIGVVRGVETFPWVSLPVKTNHTTTATKAKKEATAITNRKTFWLEFIHYGICSAIKISGSYGYSTT